MTKRVIEISMRHRSAEIMPQSINDTERTLTVVWSTGAAVRRYSYETDEICEEVLSMEEGHVDLSRLNKGAAFLNSHNSYSLDSILGVVTRAWLENGQGLAEVRFDTNEIATEVFRKIKAGILRSVSVGYDVIQYERIHRDGEVPIYRAINWQPFEISAVCVPADAGAGFRNKPTTNQCVITETREQPMSKENETPATPENENPEAGASGDEGKNKVDAAGEEAAVAAAVQAERKRCADIMTTAGKLGVPESFARDLVNQGVSLFRAQTSMIDYAAENSPTAGIRSQQQGDGKGKKAINPDLPLEERAKAEWDGSNELRTEFGGNYNAYLAYQRNYEKGNIRLKSNKN